MGPLSPPACGAGAFAVRREPGGAHHVCVNAGCVFIRDISDPGRRNGGRRVPFREGEAVADMDA